MHRLRYKAATLSTSAATSRWDGVPWSRSTWIRPVNLVVARAAAASDKVPATSSSDQAVEDLLAKLQRVDTATTPKPLSSTPTSSSGTHDSPSRPIDQKRRSPTHGGGSRSLPSVIVEHLRKVRDFAGGSPNNGPPSLALPPVPNAGHRFLIHKQCKELGITSKTTGDTIMVQRRAKDDRKLTSNSTASTSTGGVSENPPDDSSSSAPNTQPVKPSTDESIADEKSTSGELLQRIEGLSAELRAAFLRLESLSANTVTAPVRDGDIGGVAAEEVDTLRGDDEGMEALRLAEPLSRQELDATRAAEVLATMRVVERHEGHIALGTVVGRVLSVDTAVDEGNAAVPVTCLVLRVQSPIVEDRAAGQLQMRVRAYCPVLAKYCATHLHVGDVVHVVGHLLPEEQREARGGSSMLVVLIGDGCHVSLVRRDVERAT